MFNARFPRIFVIVLLSMVMLGCGNDGDGDDGGSVQDDLRIVTLAPALSQMLVDLEADQHIVGVAEHDMVAPDDLPVVGNYGDIDIERLLTVQPTHVLTMSTKQQPPARLRELADDGHFELIAYPYTDTIEQVLDVLHHDDEDASADAPPTIGEVIGQPQRAEALRADVERKLNKLRELTSSRDRPHVLVVIGTGPLMASGPDTVNHELLDYAGARNAAADARLQATTFDREKLIDTQPEVILILAPGKPPLSENDARLSELRGLPIPAVQNERIHLLNGAHVMLPSTNLPKVAGAMARAIHPEWAEDIDALFAERPAQARPTTAPATQATQSATQPEAAR